ncbi:DNA replication and repair protein RecF [Nitrospirillum amazonense]|uniref:DNA replication and repair protein RecF n=2 Tax=Nitrospirillum amazonense TaxID=28077 RepID=A0A560FB10_9PROT|nr:DNA replication and repair protein RecF [Nitrospirillum amazonense]
MGAMSTEEPPLTGKPEGTPHEHGGAASAPFAALAVTRLTVTRFRSYAQARLTLDRRPVALTGPNGAGKTNLLEAVSFLAPGRGLRRAKLGDVERLQAPGETWETPGWAVAAEVQTPLGAVEIGTGRDPAGAPGSERRVVHIDGRPAKSQMALAQYVSCVWLTPQMDRLFVEGAAGRRRFLDRLVFGFHPEHAGHLSRFEQAMRDRIRLLREGGDPSWLTVLEDQMATNGIAVAAARRDVTARLAAACRRGVGPFPAPGLALTGTLDGWLADRPAVEAEDTLRRALAEARRIDAHAGTTTVGPHRSDLAVTYLAKGMPADLGSTGEQKALLIAIVLANARLMAAEGGAPPLLLLDEVAAHLDAERRTALFQEVLATGSQAWMTGTDAATFAELGGAATHVRAVPDDAGGGVVVGAG